MQDILVIQPLAEVSWLSELNFCRLGSDICVATIGEALGSNTLSQAKRRRGAYIFLKS
jgi:hypothetical protein